MLEKYSLRQAREICKIDSTFRIETVFIPLFGKRYGEFDFEWCLQRKPEGSAGWTYVSGKDLERVRYSNGGTITKIWPEDRK